MAADNGLPKGKPMTPRQRVVEAVKHRDTDVVPYHIDFTIEALRKAVAHYGDERIAHHIGNHLAVATYWSEQPLAANRFRDHFGVVWNRSVDKDIGIVEGLCLPEPTLATYTFPTVEADLYRQTCRRLVEDNPDTFRIGGIGFSLFERAWTMRGMENLLMDMIEHPAFVDELLERICEFNLGILRVALEFPIEAVYFGDDWGQQHGTIMGPALWRRFLKPHLARMYAEVKSKGVYVAQHSCGDVRELMPDLVDIGLDMFNTFQPEIMEPTWAKRNFGQHITFWGGISTQRVLPFKTPPEVRDNVRYMLRTVGQNGGYICGGTHALPADIPTETIVAMIESPREQNSSH